jgi:hypothetical protein
MTTIDLTPRTANSDQRLRLHPDALAAIAEGIASADPAALLPDGVCRRWALVVRTEVYEAWVIAWPACSGLAMHDHDRSTAAISVVDGCLRERYLRCDGSVATRVLRRGSRTLLGPEHVHEVVNVGAVEVVSVHVYSPPLADLSFRHDPELGLPAAANSWPERPSVRALAAP